MIEGKTKSGFEYKIPKENLDNYELIEVIAEAQENPLLFPKMVNLLLGEEQAKRLKEHCRNENGIVSTEKLSQEITEIFESQKEIKNF